MVRSRARLLMGAALVVGLAAGGAGAQQPTQAQANAIRQSCRGDYQEHCASVPTGGSAALQCLKDNMASLSPGCQAAVSGTEEGSAPRPSVTTPAAPPTMLMQNATVLLRRSCGGDFRIFCRGVGLGVGRALSCLADHNESLSPECREALASARGAR